MAIKDDQEFQVTQTRLVRLQNMLLTLRREASSPEAYQSMAQAFLADIRKMEEELEKYLEAARPVVVGE